MTTHSLTVADTALNLAINDRDNLLQQCLAAKLPVARSCRNGNCGRCDSQLEAGSVTLRNGTQLNAPNKIALCISHARSNLQIAHLPLISSPQHWRCEGVNARQLRLPAGRQSPPKPGDIVAVLLNNTVHINSIGGIDGRVIILQDECIEVAQHAHNHRSIVLLNIDREHSGNFTLWHSSNHQQTLLWQGINHTTGIAAQAAYCSGGEPGRYQLRTNDCD